MKAFKMNSSSRDGAYMTDLYETLNYESVLQISDFEFGPY